MINIMDLSLQACTEKNPLQDRISELPDDILFHILSFVRMKEAGRTCLLSKRWRYVWAYIPYLNFDGCEEFLIEDEEFLIDEEFSDEEYLEEETEPSNDFTQDEESTDDEYLEEEKSKYVCWVDQVVNSHKAPTIDEFKVKYDLLLSPKDNIDNWLRFAVEKRVKRLELDVAPSWGIGDMMTYTFPSLPFCNSLTFLQLASVHVSGEILEKFLSDCLTLEYLSVKCSNSLVDLKVVGPSLNLKSLTIYCCHKIKHLEISAPNLEFLLYYGPKISSPFKSIPKLTELNIGCGYADHLLLSDFLDLSSFISQIEVLTIEQLYQIKRMPEVFPICTRIKTLDIAIRPSCDVQLFHLRFLLKACPLLHKFVFRMGVLGHKVERTRRTKNVKACPHYELKILEIDGFVGWEVEKEFVKYLIESAVSLEKVIIRPSSMPPREEKCYAKNRYRAIQMAAKELRSKLKPGIAFQIRDPSCFRRRP